MKKLFVFMIGILVVNVLMAQEDTTKVKVLKKNVVTVVETEEGTRVHVGGDEGVEIITDEEGDTTKIRIGRKVFRVSEGNGGTHINVTKEEKDTHKKYGSFDGHWAGIEFGMNFFHDQDYSLYDGIRPNNPGEFMDLNYGKSTTWNFNFAEIEFKNRQNNFGLVTGMGLSFMDFAFDRPLTIIKDESDGILYPYNLNTGSLKKSKLTVSYLTIPLLLEIKTPLKHGGSHLYLAGGVIGGLNIGSHTKIKYEKEKEKERRNFNINPFKYDLTGRIGFGDFCVFANYSMTSLFKEGKGPELFPLTFGISFPNL